MFVTKKINKKIQKNNNKTKQKKGGDKRRTRCLEVSDKITEGAKSEKRCGFLKEYCRRQNTTKPKTTDVIVRTTEK
jgi:hypothetical protein